MLKIRKTFKYRLYPNRKQRESLLATLEVCRFLYNDALQERREAWKLCRKSIPFGMQSAQYGPCLRRKSKRRFHLPSARKPASIAPFANGSRSRHPNLKHAASLFSTSNIVSKGWLFPSTQKPEPWA